MPALLDGWVLSINQDILGPLISVDWPRSAISQKMGYPVKNYAKSSHD